MNLRKNFVLVALASIAFTTPALAKHHHHTRQLVAYEYDGQVVSHPAGCPWRLFCGCGASVRVFGHSIRSLWPAIEWIKRFPKAAPAPGMAAVRTHHVMILESHVAGDVWIVYDANSGGHGTRIHPRSIVGYSIRNPNAIKSVAFSGGNG